VDKVAHYNLADVFLFPSAMEGFGLTVAEAMSCGRPVVASDRGSIPEVLAEGEGGFLCDPAAPERFVERLLLLMGDPALRRKFGAANAERVDRLFRWERCVDATRRIYEEAVETWRGRR
jgi:glycosyltransferase involved in cell wall biosynthesis